MTRTPPTPEALDRAVRLSLLPGMTLAVTSRRSGISQAALRAARKRTSVRISRDDLLLAALTKNGESTEGDVGEPGALASWMDYVNHDGTTKEEVTRDLARLVAEGKLEIRHGRFKLLGSWP